jgi:hypothetical protein
VREETLLLLAATPDEEIVTVRAEADRDLAPYRRKMAGMQIEEKRTAYGRAKGWKHGPKKDKPYTFSFRTIWPSTQ